MTRRGSIPRPIVWLTIFLSGAIGLLWVFGFKINVTASMPRGLWRITKEVVPGEALRHRVVLFCPPDSDVFRWARSQRILSPGRCPGNYVPLLKEVVALPGDKVEIRDGHMIVNGERLPLSKVLPIGHPKFNSSDTSVPPGFIWVMGKASPESFDSRYFGPINIANIIGLAEPVLVAR